MKKLLICLMLIATLNARGTITSIGHVGYEKVYVSTDHDDATIKLNGKISDASKGYLLVDKHVDGSFITCSKKGYKDSNIYLQRRINPVVTILDSFLILPLIIDGITGEFFEIDPTNAKIFLSKE